MNSRNILKDSTKSLCPRCYREIPASIVEESDGVYMEKRCPDHGPFRAIVEKDASVYKTLMNPVPQQRHRMTLVIPVTHRCNLRCKMCFLPNDGIPDPSQESILRLVDNFEGPRILFSGGEPTLRADLPELISYAVKKKKYTCIATNGLTLSEKEMVNRLEGAGLNNCLFSMNGLSDNIFRQIEGQPLLQKKLSALENLKGAKIKPILSTTVISGVNTEELRPLADFYMNNGNHFLGWRVRTQASIGKHTEASNLWLSDMLNLVCKTMDIDRENLLRSINREKIYHGVSHLYFSVLTVVGGSRRTLGYRMIDLRAYRGMVEGTSFFQKVKRYVNLFWHGNKDLLYSMSFSQKITGTFYRIFKPSRLIWYNISVFAWPDVNNVDLEEMKQTGIYHVGPGGKPMPFVTAIILNNAKPDWNWE